MFLAATTSALKPAWIIRILTRLVFHVLTVILLLPTLAFAQEEVLTNAIDVLSLPGDKAHGRKVAVRGIVTAAEREWDSRFFLQDHTAGIFVVDAARQQPAPGDVVKVTGISDPGGYAPIITSAVWEKAGTAPLPVAKPVHIERLMAGLEDSQRVEISGFVRSARQDKSMILVEVMAGGHRLNVRVPPSTSVDYQALTGASVRVRGTAATFFSGQLRQLIRVELHVPSSSDFIIEKVEEANPFDLPILPLNNLAQYRRERDLGNRVHVKGRVTYQRPGEDIFLQDATSGLQIKTRQLTPAAPGDVVEAVGFLDFERFLPVLQDAVFRKTSEPRQTVEPKPAAVWELQAGYRHADFITLEGTVLDRALRPGGQRSGPRAELTLQNANIFFTVEVPILDGENEIIPIPIGSVVSASGVCLMEIEADGRLGSLRMLAHGWKSLTVLKKPSWWSPARLLVLMATLTVVLVVALSWIVMVHKKNAMLRVVIQEKEKAQDELEKANDLLEKRVAERTAQLKVEMSARKQAEVEFKATLAERTRLAQELHDTLEQSLTGIGLQMDTAVRLIDKDPESGNRHLELARNLTRQSQLELRRSIWDLRSRELEQFDFCSALKLSAHQIAEGSALQVFVEVVGLPLPLSEVAEENLLRISQEALKNVVKHAQASRIDVTLQFEVDSVTLRICDDGKGFDPATSPGSRQGHFGLLGMSERAKRLGGSMRITSEPGKGACLEARVPARSPSGTNQSQDPVPAATV